MTTEIKELSLRDLAEIKTLFVSVFTQPPWNDDWSDAAQLDEFLLDLMQARTPLSFGLYADGSLAGIALGHIRHWWSGTEYYIEEFCIKTDMQNQGLGSRFLEDIETSLQKKGIMQIFLTTERNTPAYAFYERRGFEEIPQQTAFWKCLCNH